ncbi:MAG: CrcB family protein [Cryobacterium sp.]|nr:CrcB family protein [Cryobacterium sp.]MBX3103375.1 CrcB family protein [Cryobacterium sp.]
MSAQRPPHLKLSSICLVVLGGYTTYSTFAADTHGLILALQFGPSAIYGLATVVIGAAASIAGIALGSAISTQGKAE